MKVVSFSGVDSLGKTYYSNSVKIELEKFGYRVKVLHYFDYSFSKFFSKNYSENSIKYDLKIKNGIFLNNLRIIVYFVDLITINLIKIYKSLYNDFLILDRTYVDYKLNINFVKNKKKFKLKILNFIDCQFILISKKNKSTKYPSQGKEYFLEKNEIYKNFQHSSKKIFYLNVDEPTEHNLKYILSTLELKK